MASKSFEDGDEEEATARLVQLNQDIEDEKEKKVELKKKQSVYDAARTLLMDTGIGRTAYSIMEQGKIDLLLSSKPEDRRTVFEEAAGITKFKSQKKEALRKLDYTEANLLRVNDIIEEVKRQINSVNRQASKARRYKELLVDVSTLDTHHSHRKYEEHEAERGELRTSISSLNNEISEVSII